MVTVEIARKKASLTHQWHQRNDVFPEQFEYNEGFSSCHIFYDFHETVSPWKDNYSSFIIKADRGHLCIFCPFSRKKKDPHANWFKLLQNHICSKFPRNFTFHQQSNYPPESWTSSWQFSPSQIFHISTLSCRFNNNCCKCNIKFHCYADDTRLYL